LINQTQFTGGRKARGDPTSVFDKYRFQFFKRGNNQSADTVAQGAISGEIAAKPDTKKRAQLARFLVLNTNYDFSYTS